MLTDNLLRHRTKTITIEQLERLVPPTTTYEVFAELILSFEAQSVLEMVRSRGRNTRTPSLAYSYRIQKYLLLDAHHEELKRFRLSLHPSISLDAYYLLSPSEWERNRSDVLKVHSYIERYGFPVTEVPAPERSVELFGNEKTITEDGGKELLERIDLWEAMRIIPVSDPLMFAFNPMKVRNPVQYHLIVENKTTYQALAEVLTATAFTTLIYGSGNKIVKSIEQFDRQIPIEAEHVLYYFGDLDWSGLSIWHRLDRKRTVLPALPFYQACLKKGALVGKTTQRDDERAFESFAAHLETKDARRVREALADGCYYPQELLKTSELQMIWRDAVWKRRN